MRAQSVRYRTEVYPAIRLPVGHSEKSRTIGVTHKMKLTLEGPPVTRRRMRADRYVTSRSLRAMRMG